MSKQYLGPYINFGGRAREAMQLYHRVLGGHLDLQASDEKGVTRPAGPGDRISHAQLEAEGVLIIASDGHPDYPAKVGENMAIAAGGTDKSRLTRIFSELAEGGQTKMPPTDQPSGNAVGWLTDRFGINWMISIDKA